MVYGSMEGVDTRVLPSLFASQSQAAGVDRPGGCLLPLLQPALNVVS